TTAAALAAATLSTQAAAADPIAGALIGGGIGAAIGHSAGGRGGAAVGGVLGAIVGSDIAAESGPYYARAPRTIRTTLRRPRITRPLRSTTSPRRCTTARASSSRRVRITGI